MEEYQQISFHNYLKILHKYYKKMQKIIIIILYQKANEKQLHNFYINILYKIIRQRFILVHLIYQQPNLLPPLNLLLNHFLLFLFIVAIL